MTPPIVSVIVLNYNGQRWLEGCLGALARQRGAPPFEVLLVDNASTDGSVALAAAHYPAVRVLRNGANRGFAGGNNTGAAAAAGRVLVFLNNDTVPEDDWLAALTRPMLDDSGAGLATSRLVFMSAPTRIDSAGDGYLRAGGAFKHGHGAPASEFARAREVFGACGAAFAIRRPLFEGLGGFDHRFFMVYEDVDLSYRARLAGQRCVYVPEAVVNHAGSATLGRVSAKAVYYGQRNLEWIWVKNTPWPLLWRTFPQHLVYSAAGLLHYLRLGQFGAAARGKLSALAGLPGIWRSRREIQRSRLAGWDEIDRTLERGWLRRKRREKSLRLDLPDHQ